MYTCQNHIKIHIIFYVLTVRVTEMNHSQEVHRYLSRESKDTQEILILSVNINYFIQVDETEPAPKKTELTRSLSDSPRKKSEAVGNGCQKTTAREKSEKKEQDMEKKENNREKKKLKVMEKFDCEAKSNCVTAFKESESWD